MSKSSAERIFSGDVCVKKMEEIAEKLEQPVEELTKINFATMIKLMKYRCSETKCKKAFITIGLIIYFSFMSLLTTITNMTMLGWIIWIGLMWLIYYYMCNAQNIWGIKVNFKEHEIKNIRRIIILCTGITMVVIPIMIIWNNFL